MSIAAESKGIEGSFFATSQLLPCYRVMLELAGICLGRQWSSVPLGLEGYNACCRDQYGRDMLQMKASGCAAADAP